MKIALTTKLFAALMLAAIGISSGAHAGQHPGLVLTSDGVKEIRQHLGSVPLFDATLEKVRAEVDSEIALGIDVPTPKDFSGGYTHERHKKNYIIAQKAGALYQILQEEKYARYVRDMLFQYEAIYTKLPIHPKVRSYAPGKLFWQCLNESNWLVYMSQAYDAIYNWLPAQERATLNENLFRPVADFLSIENPQFYNRIHNHSTWGNAAVGMIGLVMDDQELIERALYGIADDGLELGLKDDDGGFIKVSGQKAGFLANLEEPFSPDGYYTEGPYYQRYAMYPFLIFALAMHNVKPEMKVFEHKEGVLLKAVDALLNLSDSEGEFFPLNDAQKGMSYFSSSLVAAVDIAYHYGEQNPQLLSIAQKQDQVLLDQAGLAVAMGIRDGRAKPFRKESVKLTDGSDGEQGGVSILRSSKEDLTLVFKYSAQGLSHGHYDKLSFSLYDEGDEIYQDYGLVRFVNIGAKGGGNYLPENQSWAKQTIAHNTVTQDEGSHFGGTYEVGSQHHSELYLYDVAQKNIQVVSATERNAYPGTDIHRTMAMIELSADRKPLVLDVVKLQSKTKHQYDLPFYFLGQVLNTNFEYESPSTLTTLGDSNGYQHLYLEGEGKPPGENTQFSWIVNGKFYTLTAATRAADQLLFVRLGANDPDFNLRRDAGLIFRRENTANTVFASVTEPHGQYSPVSELSVGASRQVAAVKVAHDSQAYTAIAIEQSDNASSLLILANTESARSARHKLKVAGKVYRWKGPYLFSSQ